MDFSALLCDEELPLTPFNPLSNSPGTSPSPLETAAITTTVAAAPAPPATLFAEPEDRDGAVRACLEKEPSFMLAGRYVDHLRRSPSFAALRLATLRWIVLGCARLNFSHVTSFRAVNYLDRFASSYTQLEWQSWMMELLAVACLLTAAKLEESFSSLLRSLPMEDLGHRFEPMTIQRMELIVLRMLDWRLYPVTPYSYVVMLTWHIDQHLPSGAVLSVNRRVTELRLCALSDHEFLGYRPFAVAMTAVKCGVEELFPLKSGPFLSSLDHLIPKGCMKEIDKCREGMKNRISDPAYMTMVKWNLFFPPSPVTVIQQPRRRLDLNDKSVTVKLDRFFGALGMEIESGEKAGCKKQKR